MKFQSKHFFLFLFLTPNYITLLILTIDSSTDIVQPNDPLVSTYPTIYISDLWFLTMILSNNIISANLVLLEKNTALMLFLLREALMLKLMFLSVQTLNVLRRGHVKLKLIAKTRMSPI